MSKMNIVVIGSSNTDMVVKANMLPRPGETVLGGDFIMSQGGKGANQAVAAARLGGNVVFVCKVGNDRFGAQSLESYDQDGIDTSLIERSVDVASGIALIMVDKGGENCIVVASGANACLAKEDISRARAQIENASMVLVQMEVPMETIMFAAELAASKEVKVILNPAPAGDIPEVLFKYLYAITPNRAEAEKLSGIGIVDEQSARRAADAIASKGVKVVIITLGDEGALIKEGDSFYFVPAEKVVAVDTTGAGDTFNGALCVALAEGASVPDAVRFACKASSIAVTRMGAQISIPYRAEVENVLQIHVDCN